MWSGNRFFRSNFFRHALSLENGHEIKSVLTKLVFRRAILSFGKKCNKVRQFYVAAGFQEE